MLLNFDNPEPAPASRKKSLKIVLGIGALAAVVSFGSTLAANINLSSGAPVEFGQGVQQTVACSGSTPLTITPTSNFSNVTDGGSYYFKSLTVSNIPSSCHGKDFVLKAYGSSSGTPLVLFNASTSTEVYNNAGVFQIESGISVETITSGSGTFTTNWYSPLALSSTVFRVTIESKDHVNTTPTFCTTLNGTLVAFTCTISSGTSSFSSTVTIPRGYRLEISGASTAVTNNGILINNGIINSNGILNNNGTFNNDGIFYANSPSGAINNNAGGIIYNGGNILSNHVFNNRHIFNNNNTVMNAANRSDGYYTGSNAVINNYAPYQWNGSLSYGYGVVNNY